MPEDLYVDLLDTLLDDERRDEYRFLNDLHVRLKADDARRLAYVAIFGPQDVNARRAN